MEAVKLAQVTRSRDELALELHKVANEGSTAFWDFWWNLSKVERLQLLNMSEEPAQAGRAR